MHQIRFRLGLRPDPIGGVYSTPPDPLAGFKGPTSKRRGGKRGGEAGMLNYAGDAGDLVIDTAAAGQRAYRRRPAV